MGAYQLEFSASIYYPKCFYGISYRPFVLLIKIKAGGIRLALNAPACPVYSTLPASSARRENKEEEISSVHF
jgi:hypothetical protein